MCTQGSTRNDCCSQSTADGALAAPRPSRSTLREHFQAGEDQQAGQHDSFSLRNAPGNTDWRPPVRSISGTDGVRSARPLPTLCLALDHPQLQGSNSPRPPSTLAWGALAGVSWICRGPRDPKRRTRGSFISILAHQDIRAADAIRSLSIAHSVVPIQQFARRARPLGNRQSGVVLRDLAH